MRVAAAIIIAIAVLCGFMLFCGFIDHVLNYVVENTWIGEKLAEDLDEKRPGWWDPYEHKFTITKFVWSKIYGALKWIADKIIAFIYWLAGVYESWGIPPPYNEYAAIGTPPAAAGIGVLVVRWLAT